MVRTRGTIIKDSQIMTTVYLYLTITFYRESKIEDWIEAVLGETDFIDRDDIWWPNSFIFICDSL